MEDFSMTDFFFLTKNFSVCQLLGYLGQSWVVRVWFKDYPTSYPQKVRRNERWLIWVSSETLLQDTTESAYRLRVMHGNCAHERQDLK